MKRNALRLICLMLVLTVSLIPAFAEVSASVEPSYDYSKEGSYLNETVTAADIIEMLGYTVSDAERAYLEEYYPDESCPFVFKYERVGGQNVTTERNENQVKVIAAVYSYKAKNGETVTWTPKKAQIGNESIEFSKEGDSYVAVFDGIAPSNELIAKVDYVFDRSIRLTEEEISEMLNTAYNNAPTLKTEYDTAYAEYTSEFEAFERDNKDAWEEYNYNLALYEQYLNDKKIYDLKKEQYDENASEWADFNSALEKYNKYIADKSIYDAAVNYKENEYPDLVKEYEADLTLYEQYKKDIAIARLQLETLESGLMDKVTHLQRQVYSSVFSGLVDEVLSYEGAIQDFGVDRQVLDDCGYATISLRLILEEYKAITNESEKYAFYVTSYKRLKDNIILLAQSLEALYTHSIIVSAVELKDKTEKFVIFVAQMIIFANSINDGVISSHEYSKKGNYTLDKSTVITYKLDGTTYNKTVLEILENDEYVADNENATPLKGGYPQEVLEPIAPKEPGELPAKPEKVEKPIEPSTVEIEPTEPTEVKEPSKPSVEPPKKPEILDNTVIKSLIDAIPTLEEREAHSGEFEYTPAVTLEKRIDGVEYVNVVFKDLSGSTLLQLRAEKGTAVNYTEELPEKASDIIADYKFSHWITPDGKEYDITAIDGDVTLYPYFETVYKMHETDASGNIVVDGTESGEIDEIPMKHLVSSAVNVVSGLDIRLSNASVTIPYGSVEKLEMHDVESIKLNIDLSGDSYTCKVSTVTSSGNKADVNISLNVSIPYADEDFAKKAVVVKLNSDGTETEVRKELREGRIHFKAQADCEYIMKVPNHQIVLKSESFMELGITLSHTSAAAGDEVTIAEPSLNGVTVKYYYYDADGNRFDVSDKKIVMPDCEIQLYAKVTRLKYTIVFVSEGEVISSKTYYYGSTPEVPQNPSKPADDDYTYTFKGWSSEISPVTGDITYIAEYESAPIIREQRDEPKLMKLYRIAKICLYVVIGLAVCGVGAIVTIKIIKKNNAAEKSDNTDAAKSTRNTENEEKSEENSGKTQEVTQENTGEDNSADK